ncbi:MAG: ABC transporter permease subunit [Deltaproteobacteria bacterium]|nr:ABC transporter permease subunit [Deltaproteobacteria bacterium]
MRPGLGPLVLGVAVLAGDARASALEDVRARGELRYGADVQGGEPYVFEAADRPGTVVGFEVDLADALARRLGVRSRFVQVDWSSLVPALERADIDVALNGLEDTADRRERLRLSLPYYRFGETLALRRGDPRRSPDALAGARIGTLNQSLADGWLRARGFTPVLYEGVLEPYQDLEHGRVDAVLLDHVIAARYGCQRPAVDCVSEDVTRGAYVVGLRRADVDLGDAVDAALGDLHASGELRRILERWHLWDHRQSPSADEPPVPAAPAPPTATAPRSWSPADTRLFLEGALMTLGLSLGAFALASPLGLLLALARIGSNRVLAAASLAFVELFRGTPLLLQLYVLYFGLAELVRLGPVTAAVLGLGLNYAAFEAEIHRSALLSLPRGQWEAAATLGLGRLATLRHVALPQALRVALPSMTNDLVALLKDSSLVSVITVVELTKRMTITAVDLRSWALPGLACAGLYLLLGLPLARLSAALERRLHHAQGHGSR